MNQNKIQEYIEHAVGHELPERDLEKMFLANPADAFAIFQLRDLESTRDHRFLPLSQLQAAGLTVERANYEVVYTADLHYAAGKALPELLNNIFYRFNMERPEDFHGHSLSVSDVVALKVKDEVTVHYVDRYGWTELHGFLSDQPLRNAEMLLEDDFGMIDGIINNGKHEPDRERISVTEQLRKQPVRIPKALHERKNELGIE